MSGLYRSENAFDRGFDRGFNRFASLEDRAAQRAVDEAVRRGLQRSFGQQQPGAGSTAGASVTQGSQAAPSGGGASAIPPPAAAPEPQAAPGGGAQALPLPPAPMPEPRGGAMPGTAPTAAPTIPASTGATPQAPARPLAGVQENVLRELAGVRGGGAAALNMIQRGGAGQQRQLERDERMAMMALQRGDLATYRFYAARSGIELPEEVLNNAAQRRLIGDAGLMAGRFYPRQQGQIQRFIQAYLQSGGDLNAARAAAGTPGAGGGSGGRPAAQPRPTRQSQVWQQGENPGEERLVMVDPTNPGAGASPVMDESGRPVTRQRGGSARPPGEGTAQGPRQQRPADRQVREDQLLRAGYPPEEAARIASGQGISPRDIVQYHGRINNGANSPDQVERSMRDLFGQDWRQRAGVGLPPQAPSGGAAGVPPPAPRAGAAVPIPGAPGMQAAPPPPAARPAPRMPQPGEIMDGFRFRGGNPADQRNWEPVL